MKDEKEKEPDFERNCIIGKEHPIWYKDQKFIFIVESHYTGYYNFKNKADSREYKAKTRLFMEEHYTGWFGRQKTRLKDAGCGWQWNKDGRSLFTGEKAIPFKEVWMTLKHQLEYALKTHVVDNRAFIIDCSPELEKFR